MTSTTADSYTRDVPPGPEGRRRFLVPLAVAGIALMLIALGGAGVYVVLSSRIDRLDSKLGQTQTDLDEAQARVDKNTAALRESGTEQLEAFKTEMTKKVDAANKRVVRLSDCLPELQTELNALSIETSDTNGYLTGAYLSNTQQVSRVCTPVLFGSTGRAAGD